MEEQTDMVEISVQISETTCYDIMIPRVIDANTYPGVIKRLKAIYGMIPKHKLAEGTPQASILLKLELEELFLYWAGVNIIELNGNEQSNGPLNEIFVCSIILPKIIFRDEIILLT
jgi:hypothetical protein